MQALTAIGFAWQKNDTVGLYEGISNALRKINNIYSTSCKVVKKNQNLKMLHYFILKQKFYGTSLVSLSSSSIPVFCSLIYHSNRLYMYNLEIVTMNISILCEHSDLLLILIMLIEHNWKITAYPKFKTAKITANCDILPRQLLTALQWITL